jgi:hypothetical protein
MTTDPAPYPNAETATAAQLARYETVAAYESDINAGLHINDPSFIHRVSTTVGLFSAAFLLREFAAVAPEAADKATQKLVHITDGGALSEWLYQWLTEYGVTPETIEAQVNEWFKNKRAKAAKVVSS